MPEFSNFIIVTLLLIILGLFLKSWEPPIKLQYIALALGIVGAGLGAAMLDSWAYGIVVAGAVFFKDALVEEIKLVRDSASNKKKEKEKGEN